VAVIISDSPSDWSPSDNPLWYRFSSDQTAQANFSFIVQTYFNGVIVAEDRVFPEVGSYAHIDISQTVKNLLSVPVITNAIWQDAGISGKIKIKVTESYGSPATNHANATSSETNIFKACLSDRDWKSWNASDYKVVDSGNFMTYRSPSIDGKVYKVIEDDFYLNIIQDGSYQLTVEIHGPSGLIDSYTDTQDYEIAQININNYTLQNDCGFSPFDLALSNRVIVSINSSEQYVIWKYTEDCNPAYTLEWINELGAWDSFIFAHNLEKSFDVTERSYSRKFGGWNGTLYQYDLNDAGTVRVGTQQTDKMTIYTDWITEQEQHYLLTLYKAPRFYLFDGGTEIPVRVTNTQGKYQYSRWEELISETVDVELVNNHNGISL
jgi:hypothetical protein